MNKRELTALAKRPLPALPGLSAKRSLLFFSPIGHTLRGIDLDRSGDPRRFYVWVFFQPLCVPATSIYFNLGWRLGGDSYTWNADDPSVVTSLQQAIVRKALPFLEPIQSPRDAALSGKLLRQSGDGATVRAIAYSFARGGDVRQAVREIDRLLELGAGDDRDWVRAENEEALALKVQLLSDPVEAQRQLQAWEGQTLKALGLEQFR